MADQHKNMNAVIRLRRDAEHNFVQSNMILQSGEVAVVYTPFDGTRIKIGDGVKRFNELPYDVYGLLVRGRLENETTFISMVDNETVLDHNKHILFLDQNTGFMYYWDEEEEKYKYVNRNEVPDASGTMKGIAKLYSNIGNLDDYIRSTDPNFGLDGSVNQKALNAAFSKIQNAATTVLFQINDRDNEQLDADLSSLNALQIFD